jgi:hypothetical protein
LRRVRVLSFTYCKGPRYHKEGKIYLWCDLDEIEEFRHKTFFQYAFVGSGPMLEEHNTEFLAPNRPVEGWERWIDKNARATDNAAREMSGMDAAGNGRVGL